jgi:hypothetical protein
VPLELRVQVPLQNDVLAIPGFGRFLAAEIEFSYGAIQTVNLLALRLQWFESTPAHCSSRAVKRVFKPIGKGSVIGFNIAIEWPLRFAEQS